MSCTLLLVPILTAYNYNPMLGMTTILCACVLIAVVSAGLLDFLLRLISEQANMQFEIKTIIVELLNASRHSNVSFKMDDMLLRSATVSSSMEWTLLSKTAHLTARNVSDGICGVIERYVTFNGVIGRVNKTINTLQETKDAIHATQVST